MHCSMRRSFRCQRGAAKLQPMPLYDFACLDCLEIFEMELPRGAPLPICPSCGSTRTEKRLSPPPVIFKGGGFYKTDSAKPEKKKAPANPKESTEIPKKKEPENASPSKETSDPAPKTKE